MNDELFTFIWNFKHGDNIMYNFKILKALYNARDSAVNKNILNKPITITIVSIVEAILIDCLTRIDQATNHLPGGVDRETLDEIKAEIGKKKTPVKIEDELGERIYLRRKMYHFNDYSYLFHDKNQPGVDLISRTVECTKSALGLKLYMVLAAMGEQGMADYVEQANDLAQSAYRLITEQADFSCPAEPQSNVLCFAYWDWSEQHLAMRGHLIEQGSFHLSTTQVGHRWYLRMVFMNPETRLEHVEELLNTIRKQGRLIPIN